MRNSFLKPVRDLSVIAAVAALLISKWCGAAEQTQSSKRPNCTIVYINGDAVIRCPKSVLVAR
jgi:hypothetical protein